MTAPGQEPDEVTTAVPGGRKDAEPDLDAVGDNHMPDDLRRAERAKSEGSGDDGGAAVPGRTEEPAPEVDQGTHETTDG